MNLMSSCNWFEDNKMDIPPKKGTIQTGQGQMVSHRVFFDHFGMILQQNQQNWPKTKNLVGIAHAADAGGPRTLCGSQHLVQCCALSHLLLRTPGNRPRPTWSGE